MGSFGISIFSNGLLCVVVFFGCCFLLYSFSVSSLPTVCECSLLACLCAPCPDLPTHLCLPVCESPSLAPCPDLPTHLCYPVFESPLLTHLLPVLTFPFILAFQFVSAPCLDCSLACICTIFLYRNAHSCCSHMYYNTPLQ